MTRKEAVTQMKVRALKYFLEEGFRSFWVNRLMSAASSIIVTACLLIFGIYILFSMNINYIANQLKSQFEIQVFVKEGTPVARTKEIGLDIKKIENVKDAVFFSKQEALLDYKAKLGDSATMLDGLETDNPLRDSYKVTVSSLESVQNVMVEMEKISGIIKVNNNQATIDKIVRATSIIRNISLWAMVIIAIIAIFIISNTIKITVFARRRDINIMKYLGATNWFISWPFMIEGMLIGVIGAVISLLVATQGYNYFVNTVSEFIGGSLKMYTLYEVIWQLVFYFFGIGILLGAIGSGISLRRHLHV